MTSSNCSYEAPMFANNEGGPPNVGQSIIAFNPDFSSDHYLAHLENMVTAMTSGHEVRIPGDRRHQLRVKHKREGVKGRRLCWIKLLN